MSRSISCRETGRNCHTATSAHSRVCSRRSSSVGSAPAGGTYAPCGQRALEILSLHPSLLVQHAAKKWRRRQGSRSQTLSVGFECFMCRMLRKLPVPSSREAGSLEPNVQIRGRTRIALQVFSSKLSAQSQKLSSQKGRRPTWGYRNGFTAAPLRDPPPPPRPLLLPFEAGPLPLGPASARPMPHPGCGPASPPARFRCARGGDRTCSRATYHCRRITSGLVTRD